MIDILISIIAVLIVGCIFYLIMHIVIMHTQGYKLKVEWADLRKDGDNELHFMPIYYHNLCYGGTIDEGISFFFGHKSIIFYFDYQRRNS